MSDETQDEACPGDPIQDRAERLAGPHAEGCTDGEYDCTCHRGERRAAIARLIAEVEFHRAKIVERLVMTGKR